MVTLKSYCFKVQPGGYNYSLRAVKASQSYIFKACLKQYKQLLAKGKKKKRKKKIDRKQ